MRILLLFILFGVGILNFTSIYAMGDENRLYATSVSGPVSSGNSDETMGSITVSNYASAAYFFGSGSVWGSTTNAIGTPDSLASLSFIFPGNSSSYLYLRNFNFNIPCNATIESMTVRITRRNGSTVDATDTEIAIFNPITLSPGQTNMASPSVWIEGGDWETVTYSDLDWGENLTPELVNNKRFGLLISAQNILVAGRSETMVDAVEMEICYSLTGSPSIPIFYTVEKVDACYNSGSITINATGGSGNFEYSINNGASWQSSNYFGGLSQGDFILLVRNADMTCQTLPLNCNLSGDERILQPGDAVITCATFPGNRITLAIEKLQPLNDLYVAGETGYDVSSIIGPHSYEWDIDDFGGEVFSTAIDPNRNIYTATTIMYDLSPGGTIPVNVSRIDAYTANINLLTTLPGDAGASGLYYNTECDQLFVANLSDGRIYRLDPSTGTTLSTFDSGAADNGAPNIAPLGERILALAYNVTDNRLYYSVWNSDYNRSGIRNTIRSISISPVTCDFLPGTDQLEITLPWTSEYGDTGNSDDFSMPVADMEFSQDGATLIMSESGFDSTVPSVKPHESRALRYTGSSTSWTLQTALPPGNTNLQYEMGEVSVGLNARGGISFGNSGFNGLSCSIDNEEFIVGTADALRGADCNTLGCIYGIQYLPITGGKSTNSVLLDIGRDLDTQQKSIFGDVDIIAGCSDPLLCCPELSSTEPDVVICPGDVVGTMTVQTQADSLRLVYHTSIPVDSASVYSGGMAIDTVAVIGGTATLSLAALDVSNPIVYYVYAITHPTSNLNYCRPYDSIVVNVRALPSISINDPNDRCIDDVDMAFTGSPLPTGLQSASLISDAPAGFIDNGDGTGSLDISAAGPGTYNIDYQFTDEFGCPNTVSTLVMVFDLPLVSISDPGDICVDGSPLSFTGSPLPPAGISGVFATDAPGGLTDNGDGTAELDPNLSGTGSFFVSYTFTDNNGCIASSTSNISVNSLPNAGITDPADDCLSGGPMFFTGSPLPGGISTGTFSITAPGGLTDNGDGTAELDFSLSGAGVFDVNYTYMDNNGCQDIATTSVEVYDTLPPVDLAQGAVCGDPSFGSNVLDLNSLINSGPSGGSWADSDASGGLSGSVFTANSSMEGNSYIFTYTILGVGPNGSDCQTRSFDVIVDVGYCYLDLALIKTTSQTTPVLENDVVTFDVTICNQGFTNVDSIEVTDYLGSCYSFLPNNGWVQSGLNAVITLTESNGLLAVGGLPSIAASPNNCITIPIDVLIACGNPTGLVSYSEISGSRDIEGNTDDFDSSVGSDSGAERLVLPGSADDDKFNDANEDDHDPATMPLADMALMNRIVFFGPYSYGQSVMFQLDIFNQGNIDLYNIEITDYIPCGFSLSSISAPLWTDLGATAVTVLARLDAGQSTSINISLDILEASGLCANNQAWINEAEVSLLFDSTPIDISSRDYDSSINNVQGDDAGGAPNTGSDDSVNGDGTGLVGSIDALTDEDDHDPAFFNVYDLALTKLVTSLGPYGQDSIVTYQIIIENQGGINAFNIEISDYTDVGLQYEGSDVASNPNVTETSTLVYEIGSLSPGATEIINLNFRLASGFQALNLYNYAEITADNGDDIDSDPSTGPSTDEDGDGSGYDDDEDSVQITIAQYYDLSIQKTESGTGPYFQGSIITYDITVVNEGSLNAADIQVLDTSESGLIFVSDDVFSNPNVTALGGGYYEIVNLPFGTSESFRVSYAVDNSYQALTIFNRVQIVLDDGIDVDSDPSSGYTVDENSDLDPFDDDESELILDIVQTYDLAIAKSEVSTGPYFPGDNISFRLDVINEGSLNASNIQITEDPDFALLYVSNSTSGDPNIIELTPNLYTIISLPANTTTSFEITYTVDFSYLSPQITNIVRISADDGDDVDSDPLFDETVDEDGDGNPFDDDEAISVVVVFVGFIIGDYVWHDLDGDGIQDFNEPGLSGITVELRNKRRLLIERTTTNANGYYLFDEIFPGEYYIRIVLGEEYKSTIYFAGFNRNADSDLTVAFGPGTSSLLDLNADDLSIDGGLVRCANIGGTVWYDYDEDDSRDLAENGINGIIVKLYKLEPFGWTLWDEMITGHNEETPSDDGFYKFCTQPGRYYLRFLNSPATLVTVIPGKGAEDNDSDVTRRFGLGTTDDFTILSGEDRCDIGAGYYLMGSIGDYIWQDDNYNGVRDEGEQGLMGVVVNAINIEGDIISQAISDEEGKYMLDYLEKEAYYVQVIEPVGYSVALSNMGIDDTLDSDIDGSNGYGTSQFYKVSPGDHISNIDIGLISAAILPLEWVDFNGEAMKGYNSLEWIVSTEINVDGYSIERSMEDSFKFEEILYQDYKSPEGNQNAYHFLDKNLERNVAFYQYRIKQMDFNGKFSFSKIISIQNNELADAKLKLAVHPNPAVDFITIELRDFTFKGKVKVELIGVGGTVIKSLELNEALFSSDNTYMLNLEELTPGVYFIKVLTMSERLIKKFFISPL